MMRTSPTLLRLSLLPDILPYRHPCILKHLLQLALCTQRVQVVASAESLSIQDYVWERRMLGETGKDELYKVPIICKNNQRMHQRGKHSHDIPRRSTSMILGGGERLYDSNNFLAFVENLHRTGVHEATAQIKLQGKKNARAI